MFGNFGEDLNAIYDSLLEVCIHDPLFPEYWKAAPVHDNGWGYVSMDGDSIDYRRFAKPIFDSPRPDLPGNGILILHVRKAASGEPIGLLDAHPHHRGDSEYDTYLVHNGSYNKENIARKLGDPNLRNQPDSEFFLEYIMSRKGTIEERINEAISDADMFDFVKTTNNIFILAVEKVTGRGRLFYYGKSKKSDAYIRMYRVEKDGWKGVVSSSLLESRKFPAGVSVSEVAQGELVEIT